MRSGTSIGVLVAEITNRVSLSLCCAKTRRWLLTSSFSGLTLPCIFADQPAENLPVLDPGGDVDDAAGLLDQGLLLQCP